jgi:hypothetical protein
LGRIPAAEDADAILFDKPSNRIFTLNGDGSRNMGLDSSSHRVLIVSAKFGPVPDGGRRGTILPGTFTLMTIERVPPQR